MSASNRGAWNVYAQQLFYHGYGHALWFPEPQGGREIQLGDVGCLRDSGLFLPLFNTCKKADDNINKTSGVPGGETYTPFDIDSALIRRSEDITQAVLSGDSLRITELVTDSGDHRESQR